VSDEEAIAAARQEHIDAFNRQDIDTMSRTATDDALMMPPNQSPIVGIEALQSWWREGFGAATSVFGFTPQELIVGDGWAYDRFDWSMETRSKSTDETTKDNGGCVWMWKQQIDGSWLLARGIWNSANEATGIWSGSPRT